MALQLQARGAAACCQRPADTPARSLATCGQIPQSFVVAASLQHRSRQTSRTAVAAAGRQETAIAAAAVNSEIDKSLRELNQEDFWPYLEGAGERLVIVDFYTDWCGPCKVMLPVLEDMAQELAGRADIVKFNCNARNKELGRELNIRVAPTFHLYKRGQKVAEMTGAKVDDLKKLIDQNI